MLNFFKAVAGNKLEKTPGTSIIEEKSNRLVYSVFLS